MYCIVLDDTSLSIDMYCIVLDDTSLSIDMYCILLDDTSLSIDMYCIVLDDTSLSILNETKKGGGGWRGYGCLFRSEIFFRTTQELE